MSTHERSTDGAATTTRRKGPTTGQVLVVTSVMFTFISFWRTAAIVLCDLASTAYYIGGIVESQIGPAAPWFILGVMLFSYAVRSVYIESCSMFVRGGVYRIVKEAMGSSPARLAVSALMFDYILTGPISGVSAGQYIVGLVNELLRLGPKSPLLAYQNPISAAIAAGITIYFWRINTRGIHESSDRALKIMAATTVVGVVIVVWCLATLALHPDKVRLPTWQPDLSRKVDPHGAPVLDPLGKQVDPLGFLGHSALGAALRPGAIQGHWLSLVGVFGLLAAFGHSILAMSGEETLAQVYREVESPKLKNFKRAALIVFLYSLLFTSAISFLAVMIIPDGERMAKYGNNLIGGLAMNMAGPLWAKLLLNAGVVAVGSLILSGAVNTAIIGSNGVLNRVAEDGVLPDWFLRPHPRYGTSYRLLNLVVGLQLFTIVASRGNVLTLGEAYAFGVVWSFVFMALAMLVLRFKRPGHREYQVPLNVRVGRVEVPLGIGLVFLTLAAAAVANLLTKEVATITGVVFSLGLYVAFTAVEHARRRRAGAAGSEQHLEQFNQGFSEQIDPQALGLSHQYRKLVAIRSPHNLAMLEKCLAETDPESTDVVVMTANVLPPGSADMHPAITDRDRELLTAVVNLAEAAGKPVHPLIVPTNEPIFALVNAAHTIGAQEVILGASNKYDPSDQLDQVALYWLNVCKSKPDPLTIRVLSKDRDVRLDIAGGSQIPKPGERGLEAARTLAELRASWRGVQRVLLAYEGGPLSADFLDTMLSCLDPAVVLTLMDVAEGDATADQAEATVRQGVERAVELGRPVDFRVARGDPGPEIVRVANEGNYDAIFMSLRGEYRRRDTMVMAPTTSYVLQHAPCRVVLGFPPKSIAAPEGAAGAPAAAGP
ncbi:MAG TPA: amino acid permease [Isosphaeraceae bacterium]|jgi:amino acid transporter/nucleotide-binding universal stress UspA family protein|nr:amino acid permease [Isosphaeraceae bacterium]